MQHLIYERSLILASKALDANAFIDNLAAHLMHIACYDGSYHLVLRCPWLAKAQLCICFACS